MTARLVNNKQAPAQPAALRAVLRPILRAVTMRPGSLYQPLYLGPLVSLELIEADVQGLAENQGLPACFGYGDQTRRVMSAGTPAVIVVDVAGASALFAEHANLPERQQIIIWGESPSESLPEDVASRLEHGLVFDPRLYARQSSGEWMMGPTLARTARDPGNIYNPVLLVAPERALAFVADEAALRLEAAGLRPVLTLSDGVREDEPALSRLNRGSAVVLRLAGRPDEDTLAGLSALLDRGIQIVLVLSPDAQGSLQTDAERSSLLGRAITLIVAGGTEREPARNRQEEELAQRTWPPIGEVLVAPPRIGAEPERTMTGRLETFPLPDVLQTLAGGRHTGRLAIFARTHLGTIELHRGRVRGAWILGDPWTASAFEARRGADGLRALVEQRVCTIGQWVDAGFTFYDPGSRATPDPIEVALHVDALALEIARRADEGTRRTLRVGGLSRVWARKEGAHGAEGEVGEVPLRLLAAIDGERPLSALMIELGILPDEALDAILELHGRGLVVGKGDVDERDAASVHEVAARLLDWGLTPEALRVLSEAEREESLTPEGYALHAHLLAGTDPQGAAAAFRHATLRLVDAPLFDATLNTLLLEVRGRQRPAADAWREVRRLLRAGHASHARTLRHYAVIAELALRAGDKGSAGRTLAALQNAGEEGRRMHSALVG